jgi:hypothetical protein
VRNLPAAMARATSVWLQPSRLANSRTPIVSMIVS